MSLAITFHLIALQPWFASTRLSWQVSDLPHPVPLTSYPYQAVTYPCFGMEKMLLVIVLLVDALSLFLLGSSPYTAAITFISLQVGEKMHWDREFEKLRKEEFAELLEGVSHESKGSGVLHQRKDSTSSWYADGR
ncbi:hypothetical protein AC579_4151 [Pseudocercospora musae]|uniref:Uncharacterized protein n=1 Tax=Pseudocercospora musae TaxID=113226 RepID=A0A139IFR7_9PEZI|nr:hypothetical protein AC579_4151 [Pseudocercospora musae]